MDNMDIKTGKKEELFKTCRSHNLHQLIQVWDVITLNEQFSE